MVRTNVALPKTHKDSAYIGRTNERAVTAYFLELLQSMEAEVVKHNKRCGASRSKKTRIPACVYELEDHQSKAIAGCLGHKADFVYYYPHREHGIDSVHIILEAKRDELGADISTETLKQIADYQCSVWAAQPTRVFVPIFLLCGAALTLVVFTRGRWYRVYIGRICHTNTGVLAPVIESVRTTMTRLHFLLGLSPEQFGHFCGIFAVPNQIRFARRSANAVDATVTVSAEPDVGTAAVSTEPDAYTVKLVEHMVRAVHPRHRLAHVYDVEYNGRAAILKLSWTPISATPESAIYELLGKAGVTAIPVVHTCGLLARDRFGYRLEYLVLEHCGLPIDKYVEPRLNDRPPDPTLNKVKNIVRSVVHCLVQARVKGGILHRDISLGNVMVGANDTVKIIDWGYGKVLNVAGLSSDILDHRKAVSDKWGYEDCSALTTGIEVHNPLTGTPLYMSISILSGANVRGIVDDIESLFYVVLHALSLLDTKKGTVVHGFVYHDNANLAMVRTGCLACESRFLQFFGVGEASTDLQELLYALRNFLFVKDGEYIAPHLVIDAETQRGIDFELLRDYIDKNTLELLQDSGSPVHSPASSPGSGTGPAEQAMGVLRVSDNVESTDNEPSKKRKLGE
ncbi:hypothetical protein GGF38_000188 [Coemansia sp. RSA 25]|nr:hypothetical protein GGF38_000188 [Coemansia sp. RSA 25]